MVKVLVGEVDALVDEVLVDDLVDEVLVDKVIVDDLVDEVDVLVGILVDEVDILVDVLVDKVDVLVNVLADVPEARFAISCAIPATGTCLCVGATEDAGDDAEVNAAFRDREAGADDVRMGKFTPTASAAEFVMRT